MSTTTTARARFIRALTVGALVLALVACDGDDGGNGDDGAATTSTLTGADGTTFMGTVTPSDPPAPAAIDDYCTDVDAYLAAVANGGATPEQLHELGVRMLELERTIAAASEIERERFHRCSADLVDLGVSP